MNIEYVLQKLGLNEKEVHVYLALLRLGVSPVSQVAKEVDMNRISTYDVLKKLRKKGISTLLNKNDVKHFQAVHPQYLVSEYKRSVNQLEVMLPELRAMMSRSTKKPIVRYFEGVEGIKKVYEDTLTAKTEILNFTNSAEVRSYWPNYDEEYVEKRKKKNIFLRGISPLDEMGKKICSEDEKYHRKIRLVSAKEFRFTNEINIYDDKIAICSFKEDLIGIIIESKEIADTQRDIFTMAWKYAEMTGDS